MQRLVTVLFTAALFTMASLGVRAADLVVWWNKGVYPQEDEAIAEIVAAFEHGSGKQVEVVLYDEIELPAKVSAALESGQPPDLAYGVESDFTQWAFNDRLVDLSDAIGSFANMFEVEALESAVLANGKTKQKALYGLPIGQATTHIHVWESLLKSTGLTLADVPREWEAFWSFWCDHVQPAVRQATSRDDVWGVGLPMSAEAFDTGDAFLQFVTVYEADYMTRDGRLIIDDPTIQANLVAAVDAYTAIFRKGCTPPDSVGWDNLGNNRAFLAQAIVMTPNLTLSIPNALKHERPEDYYKNVATIEWPLDPSGQPFPIVGLVFSAVVFKDGRHVATAKDFVRFLVAEGWLAHYLDFSGERLLPTLSKLLVQPFWLDPSDPHRMAAVMQVASRPLAPSYTVASGDRRHDQIRYEEHIWGTAIHRIVTEGVSPLQAVDDAIARIKQILNE